MRLRLAAALLVLALVPAYGQNAVLAPGKLLVASRELGDPNFAESVILVVNYDDEDGALGLIVNRRTEMPLARVLRELKSAKGRTDPIYLGGPVEAGGVLAILRTSSPPEDARRLFGDVYLITSKDLLEKTLSAGVDSSRFHVFLGYAGWGPGQLEHEIELRSWHILPADVGSVFDSDPETVWPRLIKRTDLRIASAGLLRRLERRFAQRHQ